MRHLISPMVTVFVVLWIGASVAAAQSSQPVDSPLHSVIGTVTRLSNSSIWLKARDAEREIRIDRSTSVSTKSATHTNDLVLRTPDPERQRTFKDLIKVGDEAQVSYRENDGVLTAVRVNVRPETRKK
jgi:hypothetical protein